MRFASTGHVYSLEVPEGWARTGGGSVTTFTSHFNSIRIDVLRSAVAPSVATVRASEVPVLKRGARGFALVDVSSVTRSAGPCVLVRFRAQSAADAVTGKAVGLDVERYELWRGSTLIALTLSAPQGSDNVDPWKRVTNSFAWSA